MRILLALAVAALGAPAFAQSAIMTDFSMGEMRTVLTEAGIEVTSEDVSDDGIPHLVAKDANGLVFSVYGNECDSKAPPQRCRGAEFVATFTLDDADDVSDVLAEIDYAAVQDYAGDDGQLHLSRYVIFDEGITTGNLKANIKVFLSISKEVWDQLS
ncbi:MAG: hypothetical protein ABL956_14245 [Hyphomonadaceae bacterium]